MGTVEQTGVMLGKAAQQYVQAEIRVPAIGKRCNQPCAGFHDGSKLFEDEFRPAAMLQNVSG
jgi:hypothetical protein